MAEIQTLDEKVPVNAVVGQPNFTVAMSNLASSPSVMAQVGAQVASSATMRLMNEKGLELGKDPNGNLPILPINDYLKQLNQSYDAQAQATLSLRAQDVINKANEEMANNPSLSSADIQGYQATLKDTLTDIAKLAPTGIRENLENSFGSTLQNNTHQYVLKMNAQQIKETAEKQFAYSDSEQRKMQEAGINGDEYQREDAYLNALATYQSLKESRQLSQPEYDAKVRELDIIYQQSKMLNEAFAAEKKHGNEGIEKYLAHMDEKKPDGMTYADYSIAMQGVTTAIAQRQQRKASNQSMIMSEAITNTALTGQPPSVQQAMAMKNELTTQQFNETMLRINSALTQKNAKMTAEDKLYADRMNGESWYEANPKAQKVVFDRMVMDEQNAARAKGQSLSEIQAMTNVAKTVPIPTNAYHDRLGHKISSGSPQEAMEAAFAYQSMSGGDFQDAAKVNGMDSKAKVAAAMLNLNASNNLSPDEKVSLARKLAYTRTNEEIKNIQSSYGRFQQDTLSTKSQVNKFVSSFTGVVDSTQIHESNSLAYDIISTHKKFYELAGSNEDLAKQLTQEYVNNHYGYTQINGRKEYVLNPTERVIGRDTSSAAQLIQEDAAQEIASQLELNNARYDEGTSDIKYEIITPQSKNGFPLTYESYAVLLNEAQKGGDTKEGREATNLFNKFRDEYYTSRPVKVMVTRRGSEPEEMDLTIYPSRGMQQSENHELIGGFDVGLRAKSGLQIPFSAYTPNNINRIHYNANVKQIEEKAGSMPMYIYNPEVQKQKQLERNRTMASLIANRRF